MPIRYELDDVRRRVVVTVEGLFETDDNLAIMARQRTEHTWSYGILYDLRGMRGTPTVGELRQLMSEAAARHPGEEPGGPVALLSTDPTLYGRLCTYAALGRSTALTIGVFRDRAEAGQWLTAQATEKDGGEAKPPAQAGTSGAIARLSSCATFGPRDAGRGIGVFDGPPEVTASAGVRWQVLATCPIG